MPEMTPIVLVHGFLMNSSMWDGVRACLPRTVHAVAPDLRGHGRCPATPSVRVADLADDMARQLTDAFGERPATVVGFSLGGYVALELVRAHPERVGSLVLVSTRARADDDDEVLARRELALRVATEGTSVAVDAYLPRLFSRAAAATLREHWHDEMSEVDPVGAIAALGAMAERDDCEDVLAGFAGPTTIVVGEDDVLTPLAEARHMHELASGSRLIVIPDAGHMAPVEAPDAVASAIAALL